MHWREPGAVHSVAIGGQVLEQVGFSSRSDSKVLVNMEYASTWNYSNLSNKKLVLISLAHMEIA